MEYTHDSIRHIAYLRDSLSQDSPIGFFLSAGCPLAIHMPDSQWPLIPDVKKLTKKVSENLKDNSLYIRLLDELIKSGRNDENIEDILSFIRALMAVSQGNEVRGLSEDNLKILEKSVCKTIVELVDIELPNSKTPYHNLAKWISSIEREKPIELFTSNYDLLMEKALEELSEPYFDGFVGTIKAFFDQKAVEYNLIPKHWTRLWKIHGSINWYQNVKGDNKSIYRSSEVNKDGTQLIYPSHLKYEQSRKMPYLSLLDQLSRFIKQKSSTLIVSGYSFNDDHINDVIYNSLKANSTGMVLGLLYDTYYDDGKDKQQHVERYPKAYQLAMKQHNLNIWTKDKAIIGTNVGNWKKPQKDDDKILNNYIELSSEEEKTSSGEVYVKLVDFAHLTDFLKSIIGSHKDVINEK